MSRANFYYNTSDSRVMDKSLNTVYEHEDIYFIENVDTMDPILKLSKSIDFDSFNYVFLEETNKYYYVSKPPTFKEGFYNIPLHEDVLMSLKNPIRKCDAIIDRNEYEFNLYQTDPKMKLFSFNSIRTLEFPSGFNFGTQHFIMGIAGSSIVGGD